MLTTTKSAEVRRILDRYIVEVVERYELCPWAHGARLAGEIAVEIEFGTPSIDRWIAAAVRALAQPRARVAMVIAPELVIDRAALYAIRNRVATATRAGVAEFHPAGPLDLATPARLVPFLRRSPDPMLQLVPLALLATVRNTPPPDRARQAQILGGRTAPARDVAAEIAAANHITVTAQRAAIEATLAAITADRDAAYASVGLLSESR